MDQIIIFAAKYLFVIAPLAMATCFFALSRHEKIKFIIFSFLSLSLSLSLAKLLNRFIFTPRPFVVEHTTPLVPHTPDNGFPSDHTLLVATIALIIFVYNRKLGTVIGILAVIIGVARILAKVHSPIDVLGSILIAVIVTYLSKFVIQRLNSKFSIFNFH